MRNFHFPGRSQVYSSNAMVATSQPLASETAINTLKKGGNAMDAAISAAAVLAVIEPTDTGIGGDCFALYSKKSITNPIAFNGSGKSPANISINKLNNLKIEKSIPDHSPHSITIPGAVDAWFQLHEKFCNLEFEELIKPAIEFAENGYFVHERLSYTWSNNLKRLQNSFAKSIFLNNKQPPLPGQKMHNLALAKVLKIISKNGRKGFYEGLVTKKIVSFLNNLGGFHTEEDFFKTKGDFIEPIKGTYREKDIFQLPPNTQGIISLLILKILNNFNISNYQSDDPDRVHLLIEAAKIAYFYRNELLGDINSSELIMQILNNEDFIKSLSKNINLNISNKSLPPIPSLGSNTVYLTVVDRDLNAASFINSIYEPFGSGLVPPETGILLQNRGKSFNLIKDHPNCLGPSKRPMHTIIPGMVFEKNKLFMSYGVMGGDYQPMGHSDVLSSILDHNLSFQEALDKPRFLPINNIVEVEEGISKYLENKLIQKGHTISRATHPHGGGQIISIDHKKGRLTGASDPRKDGIALGY
ncbi:MAG: gamma-glutamyltransferase [Candidatus Puniceispirillales bacterium]